MAIDADERRTAPEGRRVFVSSTFKDLVRHRKAVRESIRRLDALDISMENFGARELRPRDECVRLIREESDVFVGIYAYRYGTIPPGDERSITEQEYDEARRQKLPMFVYEVSRRHRWNDGLKETGAAAELLAAFKQRLTQDITSWPFTTPKDLAASVAGDLGRHFAAPEDEPPVERGLYFSRPDGWQPAPRTKRWRHKVAAFDLDGTLLRGDGFEFSWEAIWNDLDFGVGIQNELKQAYRLRSGAGASRAERIAAYEDWCERAVELFRATRKLTRDRLRTLSRALTLTANARDALRQLRDAGVATALISGGVNTFLEDAFPDFRDYFDFVFVNELTFDAEGLVAGVLATAYDFEGKFDALRRVCDRVGCTPAETVFVGDQFNDEYVLLRAGRSIAYPSRERVVGEASKVAIAEDDLRLVVPYILVE